MGFPVFGLAVLVAIEGRVASCAGGELVDLSCGRATGGAVADEEGAGSAEAVCECEHVLVVVSRVVGDGNEGLS